MYGCDVVAATNNESWDVSEAVGVVHVQVSGGCSTLPANARSLTKREFHQDLVWTGSSGIKRCRSVFHGVWHYNALIIAGR